MKLGGWCVMLTCMMVFLTLMGVSTTFNSQLSSLGMNVTNESTGTTVIGDMEGSYFWDYIFGSGTGILVTLLTVGGVIGVGLYIVTKDTNLLVLPIIITIASLFIGTFWSVVSNIASYNQWWMTSIVGVIFAGLSIGFAMACLDYFRGN
jgi:hypothetical protein